MATSHSSHLDSSPFIVSPFVVPLHQGILILNVFAAGFLIAGSYARLVGLHIVHGLDSQSRNS